MGWAGAAGGAYGGWTLANMGIHGILGGVAGVGAAAVGVVAGSVTGAIIAIPVAIAATTTINVVKKSFGFGKKPQPTYIPQYVPPPQPVGQVVKESLQEMKSAAQEFNAEAAVELADDMTFRKLKLSMRGKPAVGNQP
jgi:hypothetical protein